MEDLATAPAVQVEAGKVGLLVNADSKVMVSEWMERQIIRYSSWIRNGNSKRVLLSGRLYMMLMTIN